MPKKFRVISQAAAVAGKTKQDVHKALLKMNLKPEQIQLLLLKPLVIKKGLENAAALEYAERFSSAGLKVRIEAYEVAAPPQISDEGKRRDHVYEALLKSFINPVAPAETTEPSGGINFASLLGALPAPLLYGSLILVWSFALLWYLSSGYSLIFGGLDLPPAASIPLWVVTWLLPALIGAGLLIGLLYPFWPTPIPAPHLRLDPKRHARFHRLINQMTAAMDVAAPEFIEITPAAHVRVAPARGIRSLGSGDLRLTIGLAAVCGCSVQQLMGLIAGEFGRFSSPRTTRAAIWIHSINGWFARHARAPSVWDERLQELAEAYPSKPAQWAIGIVKKLTLHARRLLGRLTALNARTTQRTLLRLEQNADRYHARVSGAREFAATGKQLAALMAAEQEIHQLNRLALYGRDQLLRDLPAAIGDTTGKTDSPYRESGRLWEPHVPDAARVEQITRAPDAGLLSSPLPARTLFDDFIQLCDSTTLHDYHRRGIADADSLRVDNAKILNERAPLLSQARIDAIQQGERAPLNADGSVEWTAGRF